MKVSAFRSVLRAGVKIDQSGHDPKKAGEEQVPAGSSQVVQGYWTSFGRLVTNCGR